MSTVIEQSYPKVRWDLSALFESIEDERIEKTLKEVEKRADEFVRKYYGKIVSPELTPNLLLEATREIESIYNELHKPLSYAELVFSTNTGDPKLGAFLQRIRERASEIQVKLLFFELELQAADENHIEKLLLEPILENYAHYIRKTRMFAPYRLSEKEEIVLEKVSNTGKRAWVRFHDEILSNHVFLYKNPTTGDTEQLNLEGVLDKLRDPDRTVRQAAADALSEGLNSLERTLVFTYNTLLLDKKIEDEMRGYKYPEASRHLANELDRDVVELVVNLCKENYPMVSRYYHVKRDILGLKEMTHIDRYAPLFSTQQTVPWDEAKQIVLDAFRRFSEKISEAAKEFFEKNWIDAEPRMGKSGGAYCSSNTPDTHPVVFMSYMNKLDDVMTLAHELGHGVHGYFSRKQSLFNFHPTLPLAELASTFGEMLVFDALVEKANLRDKLALYGEKIEGIFATIFRQATMYRFEQACHRKRREQGELAPEEIHELWQTLMQEMFGDSVKLGHQHRTWWSYIPHFVFLPFYVYAYSFGELLVLSLYQRAKQEGPKFADKYIELLSLGGFKSPQELMDVVGVNLQDREFWKGGFTVLEKLLSEFEGLWSEYSKQT
ncbi:MAG TPA: M3 family oligoendopeptidase [Fimbriimonadales bacterium]|nr:M3 family oligoendopeptidase [Fimbriimonadales bacterium]